MWTKLDVAYFFRVASEVDVGKASPGEVIIGKAWHALFCALG
jgi:hypothetical protein